MKKGSHFLGETLGGEATEQLVPVGVESIHEGIYWLTPIVVDGMVRWPPCQAEVVSAQTRYYRRGEDMDCLLSARVNYRGKKLCRRHAATRLLAEFVQKQS